ncbi:T9SS type A sorting domain-containing protein, partial [bacterium]|nr:T9SS type A sorting domain-containing protein [bacterium]
TGVNVTVPIANDASLQTGRLQILARTGANAFANLGSDAEISSIDVNQTMSFTFSTIEAISGFSETAVIEFNAIITDIVGNATTGTKSTTSLTVDQIDPSIASVTSIPVSGNIEVGSAVDITIGFSEAVTLTGGDLITTLETGDTDAELISSTISAATSVTPTYTVSEDEVSVDLTVSGFALSAGTLRDAAGNDIDLSLPVGNNLGDNSNLIIDGEIPSFVSFSAVVANDTLSLGEILTVDVTFSEAVTLSGGDLHLTLETGSVDRDIVITDFASSSVISGTYTVLAGDESSDLTVNGLSISAGTLRDGAGNDVTLSLPAGNNLADNNNILVDGILPDAFTTGNIITLGAPVVSNYWNALNTSLEVILPVVGDDASLDGGSAQLEARINANPFTSIGNPLAVGISSVSMSLTRAELVSELPGYPTEGGIIQVRGVLIDIAGNSTVGASSAVDLEIDQVVPTQTTTGTIIVSGGNVYQGYWNPTNTDLNISTDLDADNSLIDGTLQLQGRRGAAGSFSNVGSDSIIANINTTLDMPVTTAELSSFGVVDGDTVVFRAVVTDVAGNATLGLVGVNSLVVDLSDPAAFTVGTVLATGGNVVNNFFNATNDGAQVIVPIAADNSLVGGSVQLRVSVDGAPAESFLAPVSIPALTDITFTISRAELEGVTGFADDAILTFDAFITDVAGNVTLGSEGTGQLEIDETNPVANISDSILPQGGNSVEGYWNSTNTGLLITVDLETDITLVGGTLKASADLVPGDASFETFATEQPIVAVVSELSILIPAAEIEALEGGTGFVDGLTMELRTTITDEAGNAVTSATSSITLMLDQTVPSGIEISNLEVYPVEIVDGVWTAGATSLDITIPTDTGTDPTLVGGYTQILMSMGATSDENLFALAIPGDVIEVPIAADTTVNLTEAVISSFPNYTDGNAIYFKILARDVAGNETTSAVSADTLYIDVNPPDDFTSGAFTALIGTVVDTSYNLTNDGVSLVIPIADDSSLMDGQAILKIGIDNPDLDPSLVTFEDVDTVAISTINTTLIMTLSGLELEALTGWGDGNAIYATAGLLDYAGNEKDGTPSTDVLFIDLTPPDVGVISSPTTVGGVIVSGYWNASNTGFRFTAPTPAVTDPTLINGYIQAQTRVGAEAFADVGPPVDILSANFTELFVDIPAADIEGLSGWGEGLSIHFRANIQDSHGNLTFGTEASDLLLIDETAPDIPSFSTPHVWDNDVAQATDMWGINSDSIRASSSADTDTDLTMIEGQGYFVMAVGTEDTATVSAHVTYFAPPLNAFSLTADVAAIEVLTGYADGEEIHIFVVHQDRAGNQTMSLEAPETIPIDISPPAAFTADSLWAISGNVVDDSYNISNSGLVLAVPIANDNSLIGGFATLMIDVFDGDPADLVFGDETSVTITDIDTTIQMNLTAEQVEALTDYADGYTIYATARLTDLTGNSTDGTRSINALTIDLLAPDEAVIFDSTSAGGTQSPGYWNAENTSYQFSVLTPASPAGDITLIGGSIQTQAKIGFEEFVNIGPQVEIVSINVEDVEVVIDASDLEGLTDYGDDIAIDFRINMTDGHGNITYGTTIDSLLHVDQTSPVPGLIELLLTTTDPYINLEDSLNAFWSGFIDEASGIGRYEFSVGNTPGLNDVTDWVNLDTNLTDTLLTYIHGDSYFMNVRAVDRAGNTSDILSTTSAIIADLIAPVSSIEVEPFYRIEDWDDINSFQGTADDDLSGVDSLQLRLSRSSDGQIWSGSAWTALDTSIELTLLDTNWVFGISADSLENRVNYTVNVMAIDAAGNPQEVATTDSFQFVINTAPVIAAIADTSSDEDVLFTYTLLADDVDLGTISGDTLFYFLLSGPDSMTVDSASGLLSWTPINADVGEHLIAVQARDNYGAVDDTTFTLEVIQVNDAPEPVTLLLPADSTHLEPEDGLMLTFSWTDAFDIEGDTLSYLINFQGAGYDTTISVDSTNLAVDVSVMDFPVTPVLWHVKALDATDTSAVADTFQVTTSSAVALFSDASLDLQIVRRSTIDTTFTLKNVGLTDLRWTISNASSWISAPFESGVIHYLDSTNIAITVDPDSFDIGGYLGRLVLELNDPLNTLDTMAVTLGVYDVPAPVMAFYKNPAYPGYYEIMIVDSLGMTETISLSHAGESLEITEIDTFSFMATLEIITEGQNSFELMASNWVGDTTLTSNVSVTLARSTRNWVARSPDQLFEVKGAAGSARYSTQVAILDTVLSGADNARYKVLTDGVAISEPILVSMPLSRDDEKAIYLKDPRGVYVELPSLIEGDRVNAWTDVLGAFKLGPRTIIVPEKSRLTQNYPNPFNPSTTIDFDIGFLDGLNQDIEFSIYNIRGQEVRSLMKTQLQPGQYSVNWNGLNENGKQVSSGIYFARLMTGKGYAKTVKMLVLR